MMTEDSTNLGATTTGGEGGRADVEVMGERDFGAKSITSGAALPKLKLTLRLPTPPLSSPNEKSVEPKEPASTKTKSVRPVGNHKGTASTGAKKSTASKTAAKEKDASASTTNPSVADQEATSKKPFLPEKRELPPQFTEQIQILKDLRAFKTRKWESRQVDIQTISGVNLRLPMWTREGAFTDGTDTGSRAVADGSQIYACPIESCDKSFDTKEKLKRHQNLHKKKMQLKLPNPNKKTTGEMPSAQPSEMASSSKLDSELS